MYVHECMCACVSIYVCLVGHTSFLDKVANAMCIIGPVTRMYNWIKEEQL